MNKTVFPLALSALVCTAQAATITVNDTADGSSNSVCTLRDAVASITVSSDQGGCVADTTTSGYGINDTVEFDSSLAGASIEVGRTGGQIEISKDLIIKGLLDASGKPNITLDGNDSNRILNVTDGTSLSIIGVRFTKGYVGDGSNGGAIYTNSLSSHTLTLEQCVFDNNRADYGGAVRVAGTILINHSTFSNNSASTHGGAIATDNTAGNRATISNSTFSNNSASEHGGAVWAQNGVSISNSTFSRNMAEKGDGGAMLVSNEPMVARHLTLLNNEADYGKTQALHVSNSSSTLYNSIIINSVDKGGASPCFLEQGNYITGGYNLEGRTDENGWNDYGGSAMAYTCGRDGLVRATIGASLDTIIDSTLADNGDPTQTLALPAGSPVIGVADADTSKMLDSTGNWIDATLDQRGYGRFPENSASSRSIGAFEFNSLGFTPEDLPYGQVGVDYEPTEPVGIVSGGTPAYEYAVVAPTQLPAGLTLNANTGVLSGTPTVAETVFFDVTVSDSEGRSVTKSLSLTILESEEPAPGESGDAAPIPALPVPLLPLLAALMGTAAFVRQRRR